MFIDLFFLEYERKQKTYQSLAHTSHFTDMMCVCTLEVSEEIELEDDGGLWRGWAVYHMHCDQGAASSAALSAVLKPLAPLQSHAHTALSNATLQVAEVRQLSSLESFLCFLISVYSNFR